jgi:L-lactate dehydrogenase complex protein LldG
MTTVSKAFQQSLEAHEGSWSRTTEAGFRDTLEAMLKPPGVGVKLPFDGVALEGLPVETDPTPAQLRDAGTGVTAAELGIADYGTVVLTSGIEGTEQVSLYPDTHVAVLRESDIEYGMTATFDRLQERFEEGLTSAVLATGPSGTADMGELVYGAHGPRNVHVLILTDA